MALDGLVIHALTAELQKLTGGKIHKIHQPNEHDIILHIRSRGENLRLLLSANPTYPRVHLTTQSFVNPLEAPMFCMLLRKHCENGSILNIEQVDTERVLRLRVLHRDELGDQSTKTIVIELTGRHSNIILIDEATGTIVDGIQHVTPAISSYRIVMPGSRYVAPPDQQKANPLLASKEEILRTLTERQPVEDPLVRHLEVAVVNSFSGISPLIAREVVFRSQLLEQPDRDPVVAAAAVADEFAALLNKLRRNELDLNIVTAVSGKAAFSITALRHLQGDVIHYDSVSTCLEAFYGDKAERDSIKQRVADLIKLLQNERNKNYSKLQKLTETIEDAKDADRYRIMGELLTASLHLAAKGAKQIEVINYYDEEQTTVAIQLDPLLTPPENAQRYFKKYTKMKNSVAAVQQQIASTHEEIRYLESVLQQLGHAAMSDIEEIREELIEQGYVRRRGKAVKRKKKTDRPALTCFTSSEGVSIYVGKNNTQNDFLTNRIAAPGDTWLHTKDIPGSHVVIRGEYSPDTLLEAAMLASFYSQAKESSQVPVDYTLIRNVRKPNGAKPGFVIYEKQKTLFVTPDEQLIKTLKQVQK